MEIVSNKLEITRRWFTNHSSIGVIQLDNTFQCYSLEDVARALGVKIKGETCIPPLEYLLRINMSNRFKKLMPIIYNVENDLSITDNHGIRFNGVRMHPGNSNVDTDACILPGNQRKMDWVLDSGNAYDALYTKIFEIIGTEKAIRLVIRHQQE